MERNEPLENIDARTERQVITAGRAKAVEALKRVVFGLSVDFDPVTGSPKWIGSNAALLTGPQAEVAAQDKDKPVRAFIDANQPVFGHDARALESSRRVTDYVTERGGKARKVVWHQQHLGLDIFEAVLQANLTVDSALVNIGSQFVQQAALDRAVSVVPMLTVEQAVAAAGRNLGENLSAEAVRATGPAGTTPDRRQKFRAALLTDADAKLTWLPMNESSMRLAWDVTLTSRSRAEMYRVLVDAEKGEVLVRQALTALISDATYRVYTTDSPNPMSPGHITPSSLQPAEVPRVLVTTPALNTTASPNGWINDGDNITSGNNADAYADTNADNAADLPRTTGTGRVFDFPMDTTQEPATYKDASVTQIFYWSNFMHDRMYDLGFTEAAGNFQMDNFGRGGIGNDPVNAEALDGSGTNNANFSTPVDGGRGRMQMYVWTSMAPDRDSTFDTTVLFHEYGHGVSNRLVGGPSVTMSALTSRGMGEGWSDFYGMTLLTDAAENPHGNWPAAGYLTQLRSGWLTENYYYGLRRYSYSTDMLKNPLTFKDTDPTQIDLHPAVPRNPTYGSTQDATQVHYQGTVWCTMLNELRANLMLKHGALAGNERAMFLVTEGMKYGPANPNFIQSRDGILQATLVNHSGDLGEVWTAFAKRGAGDGATAPDSSTTTGILEQYDVPDSLEINDRSGWNVTGAKGGPFSPVTKTLTLSNDGASPVNWSTNAVPWLSVSPPSGTLAAGANVTVTVTTQADAVEPGFHSTNLVFTNTATNFNQPIGVRLYVTPPVAQSFALSTNPGWTTSGEWAYGTPTGGGGSGGGGAGNADPTAGATGSSVFGVNLAGNASTAVGGPFYLTSTPVDLSARKTTRLRFKRWLNANVLSSMRCTVEVSTDGTTWQEVFVNPGTAVADNAWQTLEYDISSLADQQAAVQVRWGYQNVVAGAAYAGWNIDDVEFLGEPTSQFTLAVTANAVESAGTITGTLNLNLPQDGPVTVTLTSSDATAATVPATISLATGEVTKDFTITLVDDGVLDGTQTAVITASAPFIGTGTHSLAVTDDETATLTLTASPTVTEGASGISGSVSVSAAPTRDVTVTLTASLPALSVPASVTIPSGSSGPVAFTFDAPDNAFAEGVKNVTLTAAVAGWTSGSAAVAVNDDESPTILLTGPDAAREGDGPQTYTATVNTIQAADLTLALASDDTSELTVPASVVIPAGQFSATFDAAPQDDAAADGTQNAVITASGATFANATKPVSIADNEVDHYTWADIASPQKRNKPFSVAVTARDIGGAVITNHSGSVTLTSGSSGGAVPFTPAALDLFENGVAMRDVTVTATATAMTLTATDGGGKTGTSAAFDVEPVAHDTFVFSGMPTSAFADAFFNATATAVDDQGGTVTSYTDSTVVDILGSYFDRTVGSTSTTNGTLKIHNTAAHDSRCQIIYTAAELGAAPKLISALSLSRLTTGGQAMLNYKIRLKHTTLNRFDGRSWEEDGWTMVYTSASFSSSFTFHTFNLKPFAYDGVRNLMVDISFDNTSTTTAGSLRQTPAATNRMLSGTSNSTHGDPTTWTAASGPVPVISNELPTMSFYEARSFGAIPASPVAFTSGVWSGQATAPIGGSMWLRATAPSGVTGLSNLISISNPSTIVGTETVFSDGFETGTLAAPWSTAGNSGATARTQVTTANTPKTGAYHLTMDTTSTATGTFAANRPTLTLNLAGRKNVSLEWFGKSFADDSHTPTLTGPLGTFGSTMNYDGVAISQDGVNWVEVSALRFLSSTYGTSATRVFLDPVIQRLGWSYNSTFQLRFSQYDDQAIPNDGLGIDDVAVKANATTSIAVNLPATITEGTLTQPVTVTLPAIATVNTTVTLTSNAPARLSIVSPVTILAGQASASTTISAPQNSFADVGKGVVVTATASGQTTSYTHIRVVDDEQPVLTFVLPAVTEGGANGVGTVLIDPILPVTTTVYLSSGNTGEATVSPTATIGAGARSATFTITPVNDLRIDGTQSVTLTASGQGLASSTGTLLVHDNETSVLAVTLPSQLTEGGASGVGTVTLSGTLTADLTVALNSADTSEATVPASVVVPAGQTSINFTVQPVEDSLQDGTQSVSITASAASFTSGSATVNVQDNDPASFEWAVVPSPQTRNAPFAVTLTARDATDSTLTGFNGTVALSARSGAVALPLSAAASGTFVNGVWSGNLAVGAAGTNVTLLATGADGATGASDAFEVVTGGAAVALAFAPVATPHSAGLAIPAQVSAVDAAGIPVNETTGPVTVELVTSPGGAVVASASLTLVDGAASTTFYVPASLAAVRLQGTAGSLTGQGGVFTISSPAPIAYPPPEVVFTDGFEDTAFKPEWTITGTGTHRTIVTTANSPRTGTRHMTMDSTTDSSNARNEATLTVNLAGKSDMELSFWMKESGDEDSGPPTIPFTGGADFDGVAISSDGNTWYEVKGLRTADGISSTYTQFKVNLSAAAATHGLTLGSAFKIRFNHFDNFTYGSDGFAFDDITVTANAFAPQEPVATLFEEDFEGGVFRPQWAITGTGNHRTQITNQQTPRGSYHLLMDAHTSGDSRNEATLTLDVTGHQDLTLKFWMKENNDEDQAPPTNPFTGGANFDGVAVSTDGNTWYEVQALRGAVSTNTYQEFTVDLSAAASAFGFTPGAGFQIRFNHFDNSSWVNGDGFAFDDIRVTGRPEQQLVLSAPTTLAEGGSAMANVTLPAVRAVDTVITLATNRPGGATVPATITILAGNTVSADFAISVAQDAFLTGNLPLQVVATAEGFRRSVVEMAILDDETPAGFDLSLPATLAEGGTISGSVSMTSANLFDLSVALSASPANGLTLPPTVTLTAGSTSAAFDLTKAENDTILEPASTTVTASVASSSDTAAVSLADNDASTPLVITLPASVLESAAPLTGTVGFAPPVITGTDVTVTLISSDTSELTLPATVVIPAGAGSVSFDITPVDDALSDGAVAVTLNASASGLTGDSHDISVLDDEVHHLAFDPISSPQLALGAFSITLRAESIDNQTVTNFTGTATLSAANAGGAVSMTPTSTAAFINGVWSGAVTFPAPASAVTLTANAAGGLTGSSNSFDVSPGARLTVAPSPLNLSLPEGEPSFTTPLSLGNPGAQTTNWNAEVIIAGDAAQPPLTSVLTDLNSDFASITALIPSRYDFTDGVTGTNISDGGGDMYDGGNFLGTNITTAGTYLNYSDNVIASSANLGAGGQYFTRKHPGLFVFAADIAGLSHFEISGGLGADGSGATDTAILTSTRGAVTYKGFVKRVYNAGDPSVNHLIIVQDDPALTRTASADTNSDQHRLSGMGAVTRIYYLLYASAAGGYINNTQTEAIMEAFLDSITGLQWLTLASTSGSIPVAGSAMLDATFHPAGLPQGVHNATLRFTSNDPAQPQLDVPAALTITSGVHHFAWSTIPSPQLASVPFAATLTAQDVANATITNFNGSASVQAFGPLAETTTGPGTLTTTFPVSAGAYYELRTQSIYSPAEVGAAGQIQSIALDVTTLPSTLTNFTIRLKHTTKADYSGAGNAVWESSGWTTVYQGNLTIPATGWLSLPLATPFEYDGTSHLMVDFSFDNVGYGTSGSTRYSTTTVSRMIYSGQYGGSAPVTWAGSSPSPVTSTALGNLRFAKRQVFPVAPQSVTFANGVWSGTPSLGKSGAQISLFATHSTKPAVTGESGVFEVTSLGSLSLAIPASGTEGGMLNASVTASVAPASDLTVTLTSSAASVASPPASVTILAGQTSAAFTLDLPEDVLLEGPQTALISATAPGYDRSQATTTVNDNEVTTVTLTLPATLAEGTSSTVGQASVQFATQAAADLTISLSSSLTSRLTVPASVVIPAGQSSAAFTLTAPNNSVIDGNQDAVITATLAGSTPATGTVQVTDNESRALSFILLTTSMSEGGAANTTAGYISLAGSVPAPLTINLISSDTSELNVSSTVTINAGSSVSGYFTLTPVNDTALDGTQTATITASAATFTSATSSAISVLDDDAHHFTVSAVASPQVRNAPFNVTFTAKDINNVTINNYTGSPVLTAADGASPISVTPSTLTGFSSGVRSQSVSVGDFATNAILTLTDSITGGSGTSNAFMVVGGNLDHFAISAIPANVVAGSQIPVTITAQDDENNTVLSFNQTTAFDIFGETSQLIVGTGTSTWSTPIGSQSRSQRMQVIYLPSELGGARTIENLALDVGTVPGSSLTGYTIRMKHTSATTTTSSWDNSGWTTVYQASTTIGNTGWHRFDFTTPFAYNGTSSLMIDFSYHNASTGTSQGYIRYTNQSTTRATLAQVSSDLGDPLTWSGSTNPTPTANGVVPNIRLGFAGASFPISPTVSGAFVNGVWSGTVSASSAATSVRLRAANGPVSGISNLFNVVPPPSVLVNLPSSVVESAGTFSGTVALSAAQATNTTISLSSSDPTAIVPSTASVVIPAGSTSVGFMLNIIDDELQDGSQTVTITASAFGFTSGTDSVVVADNEVHHFNVSVPAGTKVRNAPFNVTFSARDVNNVTVTSYLGSPFLTCSESGSPLTVSPPQITGFVNGSSTQAVTVSSFSAAAVLTLTDAAAGASGSSAPFIVSFGTPAEFHWDNIPSPVVQGTPFPVSIRAMDTAGNMVTSYTGSASLTNPGDITTRDIGNSTTDYFMPFNSIYGVTRSQQVILAGEINLQAGPLTALAINITALPAAKTFTNFTIRIKTTPRTGYVGTSDHIWETTGFTTVFQSSVTISTTGFQTYSFTTPFNYDGTSNLMVDYSYSAVSNTANRPTIRGTTRTGTRCVNYYTSSTSFGDPLSWSGLVPTAIPDNRTTDIRLTRASTSSLSPTVTTAFVGGVWSGNVSIQQAGLPITIMAFDGALSGTSNPFESHPVAFSLNSEPPYTGGSSNSLSWNQPVSGLQYELQRSVTSGFDSPFSTGFNSSLSTNFPGLADGQTYYYRARMQRLAPLAWTSPWSPTVSSTQDATPPTVASPVVHTANATTTLNGTASDSTSGISSVMVSGNPAATSDAFANWSRGLTGLVDGANSITVVAADNAVPPNTTSVTSTIYRIATPAGDPDGNGISSLLEHALGIPPGASTARDMLPLAHPQTDAISGDRFLHLDYRRLIQRSGLTYTVETSVDLITWDDTGASVVEESVTPVGDGTSEKVVVRITPSISLGGAKFVRLRVIIQ